MKNPLYEAKIRKDNEFYTPYEIIKNEVKHYREQFKDKVVYCNCDNPYESNFVKFFKKNFKRLGLKKLIASYYNNDVKRSLFCKSKVYAGYMIIDDTNYSKDIVLKKFTGNGDFRSYECISLF